MAVGPVRALLVARAQATIAQLRREAGGLGILAAAVPGVLASVAIGPPALLCFVLGLRSGADLAAPQLVPIAARVLFWLVVIIILALGVGGGVSRVGEEFSGDALRVFPVRRRSLVAAQLVSGAVGTLPALGLSALAALTAGLTLGAAAPAAATVGIGIQLALWLLLVQQVTATVGRLILEGRTGLKPILATAVGTAAVIWISPADLAISALISFSSGHTSSGWAWFAAFGTSTTAAFGAMVKLAGAVDRMSLAARARGARVHDWRPESAVDGVSRLLLGSIRASRVGRYVLLNGLITSATLAITLKLLFLDRAATGVRGPFASLIQAIGSGPFVAIIIAYTALTSAPLWLNQFGWYAGGTRRVFLLPISLNEILDGHRRAFARALVAQSVLAAIPMWLLRPPAPADLAWSVLTAAAVFHAVVGVVGPLVSVRFPRRVTKDAVSGGASLGATIIPGVLSLLLGLAAASFYVIARAAGGAWGPATAMVPVLGATLLYASRMRETVAGRVYAQRERLIEDLG